MSTIDSSNPVAGSPLNGQYDEMQTIRSTVLSAASSALGIDQSTLTSDLQSGQSLAQIAQQQGVSADTLTTSISQALQSGTSLSSDAAQQVAQTAVNRTGGGHHHHRHHAAEGTQPTADSASESPFATLASALGLSQDDLLSTLEQGQTLGQIADQQGVSLTALPTDLQQGSLFDATA